MNSSPATFAPALASRRRAFRAALVITSLIAVMCAAVGLGAPSARADRVGEGQKVVLAVQGFSIGGSAYDARFPRPCIAQSMNDGLVSQGFCLSFREWTYVGFGHGGFQLQDSRIDRKCLAATSATPGSGLTLASCDPNSDLQRWFLSGPADSAALRLWFHFDKCLTAAADGVDRVGTCGELEAMSQMQKLVVMWTRAQVTLGIEDRASSGTASTWTASIAGQDVLGENVGAGLTSRGNANLVARLLPGDYTLSVDTTGPGQTYSGGWAAWPATTASPLQTLEASSPAWGPHARGATSTGLLRVRVPNDPALAFDAAVTYRHQVDNAPVS